MAFRFPAETLDRLARLVVEGDVVFFIGAGFSIDVENNKATRLVCRLLVRLQALSAPDLLPNVAGFREVFNQTFSVKASGSSIFSFDTDAVQRLATRYYEVNEWFVNSFTYLLEEISRFVPVGGERQFSQKLAEEEARIQSGIADQLPMALEPINPDLIRWARSHSGQPEPGKALFLDTLGFRDPGVMRGRLLASPPDDDDELVEEVEKLFHCSQLPRHRVIARFAREGWCPTTITTNYDLLLEAAFRLAGFATRAEERELPRTRFHRFARVTSPVEFFTNGKAMTEPVLLKMHGCAEHYRRWNYGGMCDGSCEAAEGDAASQEGLDARRKSKEFKAYLRSMIFTYREIQNWRSDSWAADFLRTQLRTRTVVFCGYSLQDPVIHDTFRTVYEEMAAVRRISAVAETARHQAGTGGAEDAAGEAPAFFFAPGSEKQEFYGIEVLRAASRAVGAKDSSFGRHPNYLPFHYRGGGFASLDEQFMWLYHRSMRIWQKECLDRELHRIASVWLGRPRPDSDLNAIREAFRAIEGEETKLAESWMDDDSEVSRRQFRRITAWSELFHSGLLREFSCGDLIQQHGGPGVRLARMRRTGWYYPIMENPFWTGWSAVVEVALRRMAAVLGGNAADFKEAAGHAESMLWVGQCDRPTVLFAVPGKVTRRALTIHYAGFGFPSRQAPLVGTALGRTFWELRPSDARWHSLSPRSEKEPEKVPNRTLGPGSCCRPVPPPDFIWRWAVGRPEEADQNHATEWIFDPQTK